MDFQYVKGLKDLKMNRQRNNRVYKLWWPHRQGGYLKKGILLFFLAFILIPLCQTGFSEEHRDDLLLTGFIKSYDAGKGIVGVDVKSEGCVGLREFRIPEDLKGDLDKSLINQRVQFHINSATCERGRIYEMILER